MTSNTAAKKKPKGGYPVGYAKPPDSAKWGPGRSGNPSGRPKKPPSIEEIFMQEAMKIITATAGGQMVKITKMQAVVNAMFNRGVKGHAQLFKPLFDEYRKGQAVVAKLAETPEPEHFSWDEEQQKLLEEINEICRKVKEVVPGSEE